MTIEQKARAYDEAIERAKDALKDGTISSNTIVYLQDIFPELKGSEDERIKKRIIALVNAHGQGMYKDEMIAWLEKQGEHKPVAKIGPKFHEGDWVVSVANGNIYQVINAEDLLYLMEHEGERCTFPWKGNDDILRAWNIIQDAKDGDVLCTYECGKPKIVFILKGVPKKPYVLGYHCYYNIMYPHFEFDSEKGCLAPNVEDVKPATKEQRDTLMKAMADAGYTFDFESKELKKIEQKPALDIEIPFGAKDSELIEETITIPDGCYVIVEDNKVVIRKGEKPAEWSEEDESNSNDIRSIIFENCRAEEASRLIEWLISLKDRALPQPKQEWSEEDKNHIKSILSTIECCKAQFPNAPAVVEAYNADITWLKSLRPQPQWKPSEGQLECLGYAIEKAEKDWSPLINNRIYLTLKALKEQLKKLREE